MRGSRQVDFCFTLLLILFVDRLKNKLKKKRESDGNWEERDLASGGEHPRPMAVGFFLKGVLRLPAECLQLIRKLGKLGGPSLCSAYSD